MFGYVKINKMDLTFREYDYYKAYYCGLCKYLKRNHGEISRFSLNYDITFLIVLLTAVYNPESISTEEVCIVNPFKKKKVITNDITEYAASMNILLTYYKLEDNLMYEKYPEKAEYIKQQLNELNKLEKDKNINIDEVSSIFGNIMGEVFVYKKDENERNLRMIGFNIGKYIYLLDAYEDLDEDFKKGRYNPFIEYIDKNDELKEKVKKIIVTSLGFLARGIDNLNLNKNVGIIENIIYSGVYLRYINILESRGGKNVQ